MIARTRLIHVEDGSLLYENKLEYRSAERKSTDWVSKNAKPFLDELDLAYQSLAEKVVEEIFLVYDLPLTP